MTTLTDDTPKQLQHALCLCCQLWAIGGVKQIQCKPAECQAHQCSPLLRAQMLREILGHTRLAHFIDEKQELDCHPGSNVDLTTDLGQTCQQSDIFSFEMTSRRVMQLQLFAEHLPLCFAS
jgi:hypothetical protein